ncbi:hypothetical protein D3C79_764520 [compost metagenome]
MRADELAALGEVAFVEQPGHRHADEVAVGDVLVAIGEGEPRGFAIQMDGIA